MSIQKKSLISTLKTTKKANVASAPSAESFAKAQTVGPKRASATNAKRMTTFSPKRAGATNAKRMSYAKRAQPA